MLDPVDPILAVNDRIEFSRKMTEFMSTLNKELKNKFGLPEYVEFSNTGKLEDYEKLTREKGMEPYPVIVKQQQGARAKYAHFFFVCNNPEGMLEALTFEGFQNEKLLCQRYLPHYEQVYKIYGAGNWFS